ncbi:Glycosyltransferase, catalytic subunit of cellulose synthase and poly-beta-1,6-N-acetylglucosamine synthase [Cyclonatronum proteinivorum]|uniref:Glycosyltransferase, catalytic subunit of cellulose synthase and poly-beta-1,6-N-acetylglucosamine synthase n=1 Tax=Cyclonatronum proteinivorum TaxID=1457365 RepID=A0A345UIJ7_9BACT|nr:glycosyltransferase family 2 protein [Cyclonatronum proteinivorum]AXJ00299.1 Glycosyltransferase, catalytic subunit of cellulose synthase and poly-beta-1,6-N-acetylglucosamine synthase [Cyclonatronum proteinivorum]
MVEILFWTGIFIVVYTYLGYPVLITLLTLGKKGYKRTDESEGFEPSVTLIISAWNEADWIRQKAQNTREIDYPKDKIQVIFMTDGSDDDTPDILQKEFPEFETYHKPGRSGKIAAMERGVTFAKNPILIFSDANTILNTEVVRNIVKHYADPNIGGVAGEKRIIMEEAEAASGAGEGIYWKYESYLKDRDYAFHTVVGAAGELFSVRRDLFENVEPDTLLDDFIISLRVAGKGYRVAYAPDAYASERPSADTEAEMTRKVRISAGGIQSIVRLRELLNPFGRMKLWFQYISHRVLRWTLAPLMLLVILITNVLLALDGQGFYVALLALQIAFYAASILGYLLEKKKIKLKILFVPFYFSMMNVSVYLGLIRYLRGQQSVNWARARRAT